MHNVSQNGKFFFFIKILQWVYHYFSVLVNHQNIDVLIPVCCLFTISEEESHSSSLGLEITEANQRKVQADLTSNFPQLECITWSYFAQKWYPATLTFPVDLGIEIRNQFKYA